ncbi:MAG TPA: GNAT family N-acetyltransferase, partial [Thermoanaerobaculia bacterium]
MTPDPQPRRGARLLLRAPRAEDEREFLSLVASSQRLLSPWVSPPADAERFAVYLRRSQESTFAALLLVRREDHALLGAVNLSQIFRGGFQNAYLDYWIGAPYARQGYMREGLGLA